MDAIALNSYLGRELGALNWFENTTAKRSYRAPKFFTHRVNSKILGLGSQDTLYLPPKHIKMIGLKTPKE